MIYLILKHLRYCTSWISFGARNLKERLRVPSNGVLVLVYIEGG